MSLKIYHNPRCSKSRKTLEIIREAGVEPGIVLYLEDTPAAAEILDLAGKLGNRLLIFCAVARAPSKKRRTCPT